MEHSSPPGVQVQQSHDKLEFFQAAEREKVSGTVVFSSLESSAAKIAALQLEYSALSHDPGA